MRLYYGDCLDIMPELEDKSIDLILCDLPYGTTACAWDSIIPPDKLWGQYSRLITDNGAIVLFGNEPFSSNMRLSNPSMYKYDWKWIKSKPGNFLNAKNSPMKKYEDIMVFSKGMIANGSKNMMKYYPQGLVKVDKKVNGIKRGKADSEGHKFGRPSHQRERVQEYTNYPNNVLSFPSEPSPIHPTQKPLALLEYLIKTYTLEGETVLDNCFGSCSTGLACLKTSRNFIGIEMEKKYFDLGKRKVEEYGL